MLVFFAHCSLLTDMKYTTKEQEVLDFLYPVGFNTYTIHKTAILAGGQYVAARVSPPLACLIVCFLFLFHYTATNEQGDQWNKKVQDMNPAASVSLFSSDIFDQVDDPKNHLKSCISPEIMNRFTKAGTPPHELRLKVNDICIVLRNLSKRNGLSNNVRSYTVLATHFFTSFFV